MAEQKQPDTATGSPKADATAEVVKKSAETPDYEAMLREKDERIKKLALDRDNYRAGMLKYKKGKPDEESDDEDKMRQLIRDELLNSDLAKAQEEKEALIQTMARENKELKTAMSNKSQMSTLPGGASQPEDVQGEELTADQKAYFDDVSRQLGVKVDPKKFLENWRKQNKK